MAGDLSGRKVFRNFFKIPVAAQIEKAYIQQHRENAAAGNATEETWEAPAMFGKFACSLTI
jgi:hypothetical protein